MNIIKIFFALVLFCSLNAFANTKDKLLDWFNDQNYTNVTKPGVYEGQSARYFTGGGISSRNSITRVFNFVDVQTPKFSAGCGGIDIFTGGISAINADEFINSLRKIGQNAKSLAFMLAIQIVSPQLSSVMEQIKTWADRINSFNMDSCEAATKLVGGAMDYMGASEGNCTVKRMNDFGEEWSTANYVCTNKGQRRATENNGDANKIDFIKGNIAWYVLMQDPYFKNDVDFAELVMNFTGTLIISDQGSDSNGPSNVRVIDPATIGSDRFKNIFHALLKGNEEKTDLMIYKCEDKSSDKKACLNISKSLTRTDSNWSGLYKKIENMVSSIIQKIYNDNPLSSAEEGLIASTSIPLYRFLTVTSAYFPKGTETGRFTNDFTGLIAEDILLRSLNSIITQVKQQISIANSAPSSSNKFTEYTKNVDKILEGIYQLEKENKITAAKLFEMQQQINLYEKTLMSRLSSGFVTNAMWGN